MAARLRYGLIGTGMMGYEHISNLKLMPEAEIVGLTDPVESSVQLAQAFLGDELRKSVRVYPDRTALLADPNIDAVIVSSPNFTHAEILADVIASGKHVLCEKPLATTLEDVTKVRHLAKTHRGVFWVGMEYRYMPPAERFIVDIARGRIGRLQMLAMREHRFPFLKKVGDWNRFSENTGGTMVEKCCHFFDLMRLIVRSDPVRVFCSGAMDVNHLSERYEGRAPDIIDNSYTIVEFANGVRAMLDLCMFAEGSANQEELVAVGDTGKLEVFVPDGRLVFSPRSKKAPETTQIDVDPTALKAGTHHGATFYQHRAFINAVLYGKPVHVTADDGYWAVIIGLAAEQSARQKRAVDIKELVS